MPSKLLRLSNSGKADAMALVRTILAALIGISFALSPAIGEAAMSLPAAQVVMANQPQPCCPCCDTQDHFKSAACVLKCLTLAAAVVPALSTAEPSLLDGRLLGLVRDPSHGVATKPPTHPPPA